MAALLELLQRKNTLLILLAVEIFLLCLFPPRLMLGDTLITGGDTASHFPTAEILRQRLLAGESFFTWSHGNYAGFPLFLNYFPLPFFAAALLSLAIPLKIAFKLITLLAVIPLPLAVFGCLRRLKYRDPVPALGASFSLLFLLMKENAMWGGNISSTLAGEFSYGISLALAVYLIGKLHDDIAHNRHLFRNAFLEALVALCSGYPLLQVGFGSTWFLFRRRFIPYLAGLHTLAFCTIAFWLLPLIWRLPWDTPFNHSWNIQGWREVIPPSFLPALCGIPVGWVAQNLSRRANPPDAEEDAERHADRYLWWQTLIALAGFGIGPLVGLVDIRFLPVVQLMLLLLGASGWGRAFTLLERPRAFAAASTAGILLWGAFHLSPIPDWVRWNYGGFEARPLWESFQQVNQYVRGTENDPRVFYEHSEVHNGAGTVRVFEMLPFFAGRSTLEGLYMQSSVTSPFVFYLQSELSRTPSCPFPAYYYSRFDTERAAEHMRLFNTSQVIAVTDETFEALDRSPRFTLQATFAPYRIYALNDLDPSYVVPLPYEPFRISRKDWKQVQFEWFRASTLDVPLIVEPADSEGDYWKKLRPWRGDLREMPRHLISDPPLPPEDVRATLGDNRITVETSRVGHPLWIKVSYHPDWKVLEGEGELYLASPSFMVLVPHTPRVVLHFDTHGGIYARGRSLSLLSWVFVLAWLVVGRLTRRNPSRSAREGPIPPPSIHPAVWILLALAVAGAAYGRTDRDPLLLYAHATKIFEEADAVDSAGPSGDDGARAAFRDARLEEARDLFARCIEKFPSSPVLDHSVHFLALSLMKQERWQDVVDVLHPFLLTHPDSRIRPEILYHLGVAARVLHDEQVSKDYFRQALEEFPENAWTKHAASALLEVTPPEELLETASAYVQTEDYLRAIPLLEVLSGNRTDEIRIESTRLLAYAQFYRSHWEEAAGLFTVWLTANPSHPEATDAWFTLGECHMLLGRYGEARRDLANALALDPGLANTQPFAAVSAVVEEFAGEGN